MKHLQGIIEFTCGFVSTCERAGRRRRRKLQTIGLAVEALETRQLLTAAPAVLPFEWFQELPNPAQQRSIASYEVAQSDAATEEWIVTFDDVERLSETADRVAASGLDMRVVRGLGYEGQVLVESSQSQHSAVKDWFSRQGDVGGFELNQLATTAFATPNDPYFSAQYGLEKLNALDAWDITTGDSNVIVAVLDTGVDWTHKDLAGRTITSLDRDFVNGDASAFDQNGHGTHVAGTIVANFNNSLGVAGVAPHVSVLPLQVLSAAGSGKADYLVSALNYVAGLRLQGYNIRVTSTSIGLRNEDGTGPERPITARADIRNALQRLSALDVVNVQSAGNTSTNLNGDAGTRLGVATDVITVAATNQYDNRWTDGSHGSNFGSRTVDVAAPGASILSTYTKNRYVRLSGTSMAAPHVAGVAALAASAFPNATAVEIKTAILASVDEVSGNDTMTKGRVDARRTLDFLTATQQPIYVGSKARAVFFNDSLNDGTLVIEAEHPEVDSLGGWKMTDRYRDSGRSLVRRSGGIDFLAPLRYEAYFDQPGEYFVSVRGADSNATGSSRGEVYIGIDGDYTSDGAGIKLPGFYPTWRNTNLAGSSATVTVDSAGYHQIHVTMRGNGALLDQIMLTRNKNRIPSTSAKALPESSNTVFVERNRVIAIEAEHYDRIKSSDPHSWRRNSNIRGAVGAVMVARDNLNRPNYDPPQMDYQVQIDSPGNYYVWVRGYGPTGADDSVIVGTNGRDRRIQLGRNGLAWSNVAVGTYRSVALTFSEPGIHTINVKMREDGAIIDRLILARDRSFHPARSWNPEVRRKNSVAVPSSVRDTLASQPRTSSSVLTMQASIFAGLSGTDELQLQQPAPSTTAATPTSKSKSESVVRVNAALAAGPGIQEAKVDQRIRVALPWPGQVDKLFSSVLETDELLTLDLASL